MVGRRARQQISRAIARPSQRALQMYRRSASIARLAGTVYRNRGVIIRSAKRVGEKLKEKFTKKRKLEKRSETSPIGMLNQHSGILPTVANKNFAKKKRTLTKKVYRLEKINEHPVQTYRYTVGEPRAVGLNGQCGYLQNKAGWWDFSGSGDTEDLYRMVLNHPNQVQDPQTGSIYPTAMVPVVGQGYRKILFKTLRQVHEFKNNYQIGVHTTFYILVAKSDGKVDPLVQMNEDYDASGANPGVLTNQFSFDVNSSPMQLKLWKKEWKVETIQKQFIAPGESVKVVINFPEKVIDTQMININGNTFIKGYSRVLLTRVQGDIVHDSTDRGKSTFGNCALDHISHTYCKWQPLAELTLSNMTTGNNLSTVAVNELIDPDAPQAPLNAPI